jgi:DNA polymerase I-like protein with 3'-5' exonuclease and polymerase domains
MFKEENIKVDMLGLIHDEVQCQCDPKDLKRVKEILEYSFGNYITETLKLNIQMAGEAKSGNNWFETH